MLIFLIYSRIFFKKEMQMQRGLPGWVWIANKEEGGERLAVAHI